MTDRRRGQLPEALSLVAVVIAGVRGLHQILVPTLPALLHDKLTDDGFYYFDLARHFPHPTASPGITTSGFHVLYWVIIAPLFKVWSATPAIRASLVVLLTAHLAAGALMWFLVRRHLGAWPALAAAGVWWASPLLRQISLAGVEMPLAVLAVVLVAAVCDGGIRSARRAVLTGALMGAAFLARTDTVFITTPIVAWAGWGAWQAAWRASSPVGSRGRGRQVIRHLVLTVAAAAVVAGPWAAWILARGPGQDSARALRTLRSAGIHVGITGLRNVWDNLAGNLVLGLSPVARPGALLRTGVSTVFVLAVVAGLASPEGRRWYRRHAGLLVGAGLLELLYATVLGGTRTWYSLYGEAAMVLVVVGAGVAGLTAVPALAREPRALAVVRGGLVVLVAVLMAGSSQPQAAQENDKYLAALAATRFIPAGAKVGAFDSGIYTFFLARPVINLDGVVNPQVRPFVQHRRLCDYLRREEISYILDEAVTLQYLPRLAPGLAVVETHELSGLYRSPYPVAERQLLLRVDASACRG